jgi:PTH1 family peptidyl-tRNA hydrolase
MAQSSGWLSRLFNRTSENDMAATEIPGHMNVILALGNPGARYERTRHNIGWLVADAIAERLRIEFRPGRGEYYQGKGSWRGKEMLLVKPTTYMNNSGVAARQLVERFGISPADILAVVDEIQFPVGRVQLKPSGSSGGHNGLESLITHLDTNGFPRLRCGVGREFRPGEMADYVLAPFPESQSRTVQEMIAEAADTALLWVAEGTARAMNRTQAGAEPKKPAGGKDTTESGKEEAE